MVFIFAVLFQLLYLAIGLAIFKSLFHKSRTKAIILLIIIIFASVYQLAVGYSQSIALGITMTVVAAGMGAITFIMTKKGPPFGEAV